MSMRVEQEDRYRGDRWLIRWLKTEDDVASVVLPDGKALAIYTDDEKARQAILLQLAVTFSREDPKEVGEPWKVSDRDFRKVLSRASAAGVRFYIYDPAEWFHTAVETTVYRCELRPGAVL